MDERGIKDKLREAAWAAHIGGFERLCLTCHSGFDGHTCPTCDPNLISDLRMAAGALEACAVKQAGDGNETSAASHRRAAKSVRECAEALLEWRDGGLESDDLLGCFMEAT